MLDKIRKRKDNFIYSILILAVIAVMAMYGVDKMNKSDSSGGAPAAWVNGEIISQREFRQELGMRIERAQAMLGAQYDEKFIAALGIPQQTLEELIQLKLLSQQASRMNILVPDKELATFIQSLPGYQRDGKFDRDAYLRNPFKGEEERRMRERLQIARLQTYLSDRIRLTPAELEWSYKLRDTKVDLEYAKIDFNALASSQKPSPKEVEALLSTNSGPAIQQYYDAHQKDYSQPASVNLRQIRVGVPFKASDAQKADAKKKADALATEVTADNFSKIATTKSDDEYAKKGGLVGWVSRGTLEEPLEKALDSLDPGKVSPVVETSFGYFILKADDKKKETITPIDKVKHQIAEKLVAENHQKELSEGTRKRWEEMLAGGKPLEPELKRFKIDTKKTGPFSAGSGYIPNIGQADVILDGVFELSKQQPVAKKLFFHGNNYYYVKLLTVEYPKAETFTKDRDVIDRGASGQIHSQLMKEWLASLQKTATIKSEIDMAKKGGEDSLPVTD